MAGISESAIFEDVLGRLAFAERTLRAEEPPDNEALIRAARMAADVASALEYVVDFRLNGGVAWEARKIGMGELTCIDGGEGG